MSPLPPPVVSLPFLLALLPAAAPAGGGERRLASAALVCAFLTLLLAVLALLPYGGWLALTGPGWRDDAPAQALSLLPAAGWLVVALRALAPGESARAAGRWRRWPVAAQLGVAASMALCRADALALLPLLFAATAWALLLPEGRGMRDSLPWLLPILPAALGAAIVSAALGAPADWTGLLAARELGGGVATGLSLLLVPILGWTVALFVRAAVSDRGGPARGLLPSLLLVPASCLALRLGALPLPPLARAAPMLAGVAGVASCLLLLPGARTAGRRLRVLIGVQAGAVLLAAGGGGPAGAAAAVMLLGFLCLLAPLVLCFAPDRWHAGMRGAAIAVLAGLPPFGPFAALLMLLMRLFGAPFSAGPLLAAFLLLAVCLVAASLIGGLREPVRPAAGGRVTPLLLSGALVLAGCAVLGLFMPIALSDRLLALAGGGR